LYDCVKKIDEKASQTVSAAGPIIAKDGGGALPPKKIVDDSDSLNESGMQTKLAALLLSESSIFDEK
jgi:hypothetical protein